MSSSNGGKNPEQVGDAKWLLVYLMFTAMISGALIMVVEVLGSRVIGPFFGVSLFVWTSLIAVTLISLSLGYAIGGYIADKRGTAEYLFGIILLAGVAVLLIPFLKSEVLKFCVPLGLRWGAFVSTALLFGPALFLLGCVSPYLIKIAASELKSIGRTVGGFYALSTVGSVIGTVLTGFFLIAYLGVDNIFYLVGTLLVLLALIFFVFFRQIRWAASLVALPLLIFLTETDAIPSRVMKNGTRVTLVASHDSYYGSLKVVEYSYGNRRTRELIIDGLIQGGIDVSTGQSIYAYTYYLTLLPYALHAEIEGALVIGMGAGIVPRWFERQGIRTDVVDIDPTVFDYARRFFDVQVSGREFVQDARYFAQTSKDKYDVVVLDVFNGDTTPAHLLSLESLRLLGERLADRGLLAINLVGSLYADNYMTASIVKTLRKVFDQVDVYPTVDLAETGGGNLAVIAYQGTRRQADFSRIDGFDISHYARDYVVENLGGRFEFPEGTPALVLTDDYNPVDFFDADLKEDVRRDILDTTEWDILIFSD
jgi:spermidine synthase